MRLSREATISAEIKSYSLAPNKIIQNHANREYGIKR